MIIEYSRDKEDQSTVFLGRLNTLLEFYIYLPLVVKKDKNKSTAIYYVLNSNKSPGHKENLEELKKNIGNGTLKDKNLRRNIQMV